MNPGKLAVAMAWLVTGSVLANADRIAPPPVRRIFASSDGRFGCHILLKYENRKVVDVRGVLFNFDEEGNEQRLWERKISFVPITVLISNDGAVVFLNEWWSPGHDHSLVVLSRSGTILADYRLEAILSEEEIENHVSCSVSSRAWDYRSTATFDRERLVIRLEWGKEIVVDLASGGIVGAADGGERKGARR